MTYNEHYYIDSQITTFLRQLANGEIADKDVNWFEMRSVVRRCRELRIMDEFHRQLQPYYEMYLFADSKLINDKSFNCLRFIEECAKTDNQFAFWAEQFELDAITEAWADYLRKADLSIGYYRPIVRILLEGGYDTNWHQLAENLKNDLHKAEVYSDYKTGELIAFLHGVAMLMSTSWDDAKKMELFDLLCDNWEFLKHFYSVMIRRPIGCRLPNFSAVANLLVQQPKYHQYIHIFYCVLCYREPTLNLSKTQKKSLDNQMERIQSIMDNTKPSDNLDELCDTLFPEDFQRMLDEFRPETREQVEKERNRLRYEVGLLTDQMSAMANRLKEALENSVPIPEIEKQLLRLSPGTALDLCGKMTLMLSDNQAWMTNMPGIKEKILKKKKEQDQQLAELLQQMAGKTPVAVTAGNGGVVQITDKEIINSNQTELPELL